MLLPLCIITTHDIVWKAHKCWHVNFSKQKDPGRHENRLLTNHSGSFRKPTGVFMHRLFCLSSRRKSLLLPRLSVFPYKANKGINLSSSNVLLQQLAVIMEQCCYGVFCQDVIPNLLLHKAKLLGYIFLAKRKWVGWRESERH